MAKDNQVRVASNTKAKIGNPARLVKRTLFSIKNLFNGTGEKYERSIQKAILWVREFVEEFKDTIEAGGKPPSLIDRHILKPGYFYMFSYESYLYNEKTRTGKRKLEFYDEFPIILVLDRGLGDFLGFNFHYLPVKLRLRVLDKIVRGWPKDYVMDNLLMPMKYEIFKMRMGGLWRHVKHAVKLYKWENVLRMRGMKVRRIKNLDVSNALMYTSATWVGTTENQVYQKYKV